MTKQEYGTRRLADSQMARIWVHVADGLDVREINNETADGNETATALLATLASEAHEHAQEMGARKQDCEYAATWLVWVCNRHAVAMLTPALAAGYRRVAVETLKELAR